MTFMALYMLVLTVRTIGDYKLVHLCSPHNADKHMKTTEGIVIVLN